jgi:ribosome biogenesis GTPase
MSERADGIVVVCHRDEWEVLLPDGAVVRSSLRGRHFAAVTTDDKPIAPGDRVRLGLLPDGTAVIDDLLPRERVLSRRLPRSKREVEQVVVANAEQLVAVGSLAAPQLNRRLLDRFLVIGGEAGLSCAVVLNKTDLAGDAELRSAARAYEIAGYRVIPTSAVNGRGVPELASLLAGRFSVIAGPSGAGKSSLLNAVEPGLGIRVGDVSRKTGKGRHTTSSVTLFRLPGGGLVADTPGFRELGLWRVNPDELDSLFPEIGRLALRCRFRGCSHGPEPGCAVKEAVENDDIDAERYGSYLKLRAELSPRE